MAQMCDDIRALGVDMGCSQKQRWQCNICTKPRLEYMTDQKLFFRHISPGVEDADAVLIVVLKKSAFRDISLESIAVVHDPSIRIHRDPSTRYPSHDSRATISSKDQRRSAERSWVVGRKGAVVEAFVTVAKRRLWDADGFLSKPSVASYNHSTVSENIHKDSKPTSDDLMSNWLQFAKNFAKLLTKTVIKMHVYIVGQTEEQTNNSHKLGVDQVTSYAKGKNYAVPRRLTMALQRSDKFISLMNKI
ncbi:hypothetical protein CBL_13081 [Carabus blaptoides fortunei]